MHTHGNLSRSSSYSQPPLRQGAVVQPCCFLPFPYLLKTCFSGLHTKGSSVVSEERAGDTPVRTRSMLLLLISGTLLACTNCPFSLISGLSLL